MQPKERFRCEVLGCTLRRQDCAGRHARSEALKKRIHGGWEPGVWTKFISCRGCPIGASHVRLLGVHVPGMVKYGSVKHVFDVKLPEPLDPVEEPDAGVEYAKTRAGWYVRGWTKAGTLTAGPFSSFERAKRWISVRMRRV